MLHRLQFTAFLLAWFLATGAQWDVMQVFGWGRMVANYSRSMSLGAAVKKTFSGEMCGVCHAVSEASQQETSAGVPDGKRDFRMVLVLQPTTVDQCPAPGAWSWTFVNHVAMTIARAAPPLQPPRV